MSEILAIGISHKTAHVAMRERLSLTSRQAALLLRALCDEDEIHEAAALSTCNRTELYLVAGDPVGAEARALTSLAEHGSLSATELAAQLYTVRDGEAAAHLLRVASGLDSMLVGESEILGQVKRGHELALEEQTTGPVLNRMFAQAISGGKRVQAETEIGARHVSIAGAAVNFARQQLGDLTERRTLIIGAGGNGELAARALSAAGAKAVFVANRNYDRAIGVAHSVGGEAVRFDRLPEELLHADIVLSSTGSPHTLIHRDELAAVMQRRAQRALLVIDVAVPRDIDPAVKDLQGVKLLDIDDLQDDIEHNLKLRRGETSKAEVIVEQEAESFGRWLETLDVLPTVTDLRRRADRIAEQVLAENVGRFEALSEADRARVEAMARTIVTRILHDPTLKLKQASAGDEGQLYAQVMRELFGLDAEPADANAASEADVVSIDQLRQPGSRLGRRE